MERKNEDWSGVEKERTPKNPEGTQLWILQIGNFKRGRDRNINEGDYSYNSKIPKKYRKINGQISILQCNVVVTC